MDIGVGVAEDHRHILSELIDGYRVTSANSMEIWVDMKRLFHHIIT